MGDVKIMKKCAFASLLVAVVLLVSCVTNSAPQQGNVSREKYFLGTYSAVFASPIIAVDKAVRETCNTAKLRVTERRNTANSCEYQYKDVNNIPLRITLLENKDKSVKITLKVGGVTGWDKEACQLLLVNIDSYLRSHGNAESAE